MLTYILNHIIAFISLACTIFTLWYSWRNNEKSKYANIRETHANLNSHCKSLGDGVDASQKTKDLMRSFLISINSSSISKKKKNEMEKHAIDIDSLISNLFGEKEKKVSTVIDSLRLFKDKYLD